MKTHLIEKTIISMLCLSFLIPFLVEAQITFEPPTRYRIIEDVINSVISFIFWVAMAIAPLAIIIAAYYFLTSGGDPEKVRTAKKIIFWVIIGLIIIFWQKA